VVGPEEPRNDVQMRPDDEIGAAVAVDIPAVNVEFDCV
jgi:hypothetical protein